MNRKGTLLVEIIVFLVLWTIASLLWSLIFNGILVIILGCLTSLVIIGVFKVIVYFDR